ncbi:hypothetical protein N7493_011200 [Penicillium malachiteum]|uniref:67 kDa myosin-cross-reactive antigen family protein n=1 Tax=Penicillium malachiteum TaxID=1324776 RepID=A0AAD6MR55_9EURO|nr:hypothetical protein N7493_011200 [Penicillium malachiteum]
MNDSQNQESSTSTSTGIQAWILGSGTASLASAVYLIQRANLPPQNVHVLDAHISLGGSLYHHGSPTHGYNQFAGCLPVPVGTPVRDLLASIPSPTAHGRTVLDTITKEQDSHIPGNCHTRTKFLLQKTKSRENINPDELHLSVSDRLYLARLVLRSEKRFHREHIKDIMPKSFFQSVFWSIWSAQFGFQPWHSAVEFRRALRQYLHQYHSLSILNSLDISGYYQFESIILPVYLYLQSIGVDFHFDTTVEDLITTSKNGYQRVSKLKLVENGFHIAKDIGTHDIVIMMLGSSTSGSSIGTNDASPMFNSLEPDDEYDENWKLWLELGTQNDKFGNPYNFCTRMNDSILGSFTMTITDRPLWEFLTSRAAQADCGTFIMLPDSNWELRLCIPTQPVFSQQPQNVYVIWGFTLFPSRKGNYVNKSMEECSGTQITAEVLQHLQYHPVPPNTLTIPSLMPRMTSMLLVRSKTDRPDVIPPNTSNLALVGQFVEIPDYTCVDVSYGIRAAQIATSRLMNVSMPDDELRERFATIKNLLRLLSWR